MALITECYHVACSDTLIGSWRLQPPQFIKLLWRRAHLRCPLPSQLSAFGAPIRLQWLSTVEGHGERSRQKTARHREDDGRGEMILSTSGRWCHRKFCTLNDITLQLRRPLRVTANWEKKSFFFFVIRQWNRSTSGMCNMFSLKRY